MATFKIDNHQIMRNITLILIFTCSIITQIFAQDLAGAYLNSTNNSNKLLLIVDGYVSLTSYEDTKYLGTQGGAYQLKDGILAVLCEFDDQNPQHIGETGFFEIQVDKEGIQVGDLFYKKQKAIAQDLDGLWRITGRQTNDGLQEIKRGDRKTIKLLVDGYFQWIAINPAQKGFYGTGGGNYSFSNGKYSETIRFFSRDNTRVGALLNFDGEIENSQWHHSGKSSKGDPIHEIWSRDN